ncbi:Hpt domain-containing protein [Paenibacillus campi]|uniref:Hpt domain-containing protein n=1 Tax=Paenibacillus campi TaxID=3106031 RepID=UPI002AFE922B|nr:MULTISPECIES: Hpt domain-containing protein [unclassified Paenibacillus]
MSKAERYRQIIEQTRVRFLHDATTKMHDLHQIFADYRQFDDPDPQAGSAVADRVHRHIHAIKGLALTLSYASIDELCGEMIHFILNDPPKIWKREYVEQLERYVHQLEQLLHEAAAAPPQQP